MRIGLTFNLKPPGASGDEYEEFDSEETIAGLESAIRLSGHDVIRLGWGSQMLDVLARERVDGVFNIAEGMGGRGRESQVPAVLEMLGIPCSGSSALAIGLTLDKALAKRVAQSAGIATAPFEVSGGQAILPVRSPNARSERTGRIACPPLRFPLFAKPANEGSSMGITAASLCRDEAQLEATVANLAKYGPVLIEEFLPGDEYTVGIVDGEVIGAMQVVPRTPEENFIYSLDVKRDYLNLVEYRFVKDDAVNGLAIDVWNAFGLRDVARIDVRRDRNDLPNFVEVNPLPGVHPINSDLVIIARLAGITHADLIGRIVRAAERRWAA